MTRKINGDECIACGCCAGMCPNSAISQGNDGAYIVDETKCTDCGDCDLDCPIGCITKKD